MGFYADVMHMARLWDTARDKSTTGEEWLGLDWIGLDWIGLDWIGLDRIGWV